MVAVWSKDLKVAGEGAGNLVRRLLQSFWIGLAQVPPYIGGSQKWVDLAYILKVDLVEWR